jgi:single-stranded-DNA-specific exonuclease
MRAWHQGAIGIVASRLVERRHLPTVLISLHDGIGRGSGRSVPGVDLTRILQGCDDLADRARRACLRRRPHGRERSVARVPRALRATVQEALATEDVVPRIAYEAELEPAECDLELVEALDQLAPFGLDNPEPIFRMNDVRILHAKEVGQGKHIRFDVACAGRDERGHTLEAIGFGLAEHLPLERTALLGARRSARRAHAQRIHGAAARAAQGARRCSSVSHVER